LRVIAGLCKSRPLKPVPGHHTRPTTDKVKETLFNIIGPYFDGGQVLDLYGGTGALAIEALSRGMEKGFIIDSNGAAIRTIKENIETCDFTNQTEIYRVDAGKALAMLGRREEQFDLIFLDPPYAKARFEKDFEAIIQYNLLRKDGLIIAEHDAEITLPEQWSDDIVQYRREVYQGYTAITFYEHL
jgi:16S rRNA (guanine966-N2)-methyltransferase